MYRSIQNTYRQYIYIDRYTYIWQQGFLFSCSYRIVLPEELISITETDLWECWQKPLIADTDSPFNSIADPDFGLETN